MLAVQLETCWTKVYIKWVGRDSYIIKWPVPSVTSIILDMVFLNILVHMYNLPFLHGFTWLCIVVFGFTWFHRLYMIAHVLHGCTWSFMVVYSFTWATVFLQVCTMFYMAGTRLFMVLQV